MKKIANYPLKMFFSFKLVFCFFLLLHQTGSVKIEVENLPKSCNFSKCERVIENPNYLNVHLVPHTHDDVGWLKTVDQYFYGTRSDIANANVELILDSVIAELIKNKDRKFIYVETAFFSMWWREQDAQTKAIVKELVNTGQLEFIGGGWTMNDEATTHYSSIIDQMTLGHRWLNDTFGHCAVPRVAWQIDPFGHSKEQAAIFAAMNFDGLFLARIDWQDHSYRRTAKTMEHVWHGSEDLGTGADLFTSVINNGYGPPEGFNWDLLGGNDDPVIDDHSSEEYNVDAIVEKFVAVSKRYSLIYATNHILFPMGEDFNYQSAGIWYKNMDKLIKAVNQRTEQNKVRVFYSTPSCYLKAVHDTGHVFQTKEDDFFPYASDPNAFWTGYFTSRATLKRFERVGNNWLQACKQLDVLAAHEGTFEWKLSKLKEAMGVMQHHDAVAGTEKQHVANDYAKQLQLGINECKDVINHGLAVLVSNFRADVGLNRMYSTDYQFCDLLNISSCYASETYRNLVVTLYNPFGQTVQNHTVRLPVKMENEQYFEVLDGNLNPVPSTLFPIPKWILTIPGRSGKATYELVFDIAEIQPLGFVSVFIKRTDTATWNTAIEAVSKVISEETVFRQGEKKIFFNKNGVLDRVSLPGKTVELKNSFHYYEGHTGNNKVFINRSSGAYIFRPKEQTTKSLGDPILSVLFFDARSSGGKLIEIQQTYNSFVRQSIRIHPDKEFIEFDWFVGSIPVNDGVGKEVVARYSTDLITRRTFYTDANGRQIMKRIRDYRPSWNYTVFEPVSGNYYPVNSRIFIRDYNSNVQLSLLTDRSQGGSSLREGEIELMLHRRLLHDDAFGVAEALNETGLDGRGLVVRGRHFLLLSPIESAAAQHRPLSQQLYLEPVIALMPKYNLHKYSLTHRTFYSGLNQHGASKLPANVHILTLEQWRPKSVLLRLENFYQEKEDAVLSKPATVDLSSLFPFLSITGVQEMTLSANQDISAQMKRLQFKYSSGKDSRHYHHHFQQPMVNSTVQLSPMQIRTFIVTYQ